MSNAQLLKKRRGQAMLTIGILTLGLLASLSGPASADSQMPANSEESQVGAIHDSLESLVGTDNQINEPTELRTGPDGEMVALTSSGTTIEVPLELKDGLEIRGLDIE